MNRVFSILEFDISEDKTVVVNNKSVSPLKIINPKISGSSSLCMLTNYGGGFVEGDSVSLCIFANEQTQSVITTQANTRIYKSKDHKSSQYLEGFLEKDSFHVFLNDPLVMHKGGNFVQKGEWQLQEGAVLLIMDWFSAGRTENEESFDFQFYESDTKVMMGNFPVIWDKFQIDPSEDDMGSPAGMDGNSTYLNIFLAGHEAEERVSLIENHLNVVAEEKLAHDSLDTAQNGHKLAGSSERVNEYAYIARYAARDIHTIKKVIGKVAEILDESSLLGNNPLERKY